jgi:hypothetical protein
MPTENETIEAEKMRKKRFVAVFGKCLDCDQPVTEGQEFLRSEEGLRHALCFYDPAFAKRVRAAKLNPAR